MKRNAILLLIAGAFAAGGCETDLPRSSVRENPLQRGLRGEGTLMQHDYSNDPFVREETRSTY
jgi:hypothetical protein